MLILLGRNVAGPLGLHHPVQTLPDFIRRVLDLVVMRNAGTLIDRLDLASHTRCFLENIGKFFVELSPFRVHANLLGNYHKNLADPA